MALLRLSDQGYYDPDTGTWFKDKDPDAVAKKQSEINHITRQILDQNTTKYWTGEGYGSYEANARGIATWLNNVGITDLKQFGVKEESITEPVEVIGRQIDGNQALMIADDWGGGRTYIVRDRKTGQQREITEEEYNKATPLYGKRVFGGWDTGDSFEEIDQTKITVNKDGTAIYDTGRKRGVYVNKDTGQVLSDISYGGRGFHYVGDEVDYNGDPSKPNQVAQTFAGKGGTGISVQFAQDGTPYFFTHYTGSTSDWGDVAPIVAFGLAATGVGGLIGGALTEAVGVTTAAGFSASTVATASAIAGGAVVGGTLSELAGGDFLKGAVMGAVSSGVGSNFAADVGGMLGLEGKLAEQVGSAIISGAKAEITGGDFLKGAAIDGLVSTVSDTTGYKAGDIKKTISFVSAIDSGDSVRIAAALGGMTNLSYFNEKKAKEIMDKLGKEAYVDRPPPTQEEIEAWAKTPAYEKLPDDYVGTPTTTGEKPFDATEISHRGEAGDASYEGYTNDFGTDQKKPWYNISLESAGKGLLAAAGVSAAQKVLEPKAEPVPDVLATTTTPNIDKDIYADAPIKGFAMRKFQDDSGTTRYIPFIGDRAQLKVPEGFKPVGFNQGGFVTRRS